MKLTTNRLVLRSVKSSDVKSIVENLNDLEVSRWLLKVPHPYKLKDAKDWLKISKKNWRKKNKKDYSFTIELKEEHKAIGGIGLHKVDKEQGTAETGYWLGRRYHRKGYGTEALAAILKLAFKKLKLRRVEAGVYPGNPSSAKLLEHFGFKLEGTRRKARVCKADGKLHDEHIYGLVKR
jgi:ribosomal-protein-alanine N-acetyltransferase